MSRRVAVVTDSTAYLPDELAARYTVTVVPLRVVVDGVDAEESSEVRPEDVTRALTGRRQTVTTSRPSPADFLAAYQAAAEDGAEAVLSVHLSAKLSGTYEAAELAAAEADLPVAVVDSRSTAMGLGFAVLAAAEVAQSGGDLDAVRTAAVSTAARTTCLFYVDSLEYLRRGGRVGAAAAFLGTALSVKPILHVVDGAIVMREKVRTTSRGIARLEELTVETVGDAACDLAVHHLAAAGRAEALRDRLQARLPRIGRLVVSEVGAAVGAHVGPGLVGVVVVRHP